MRVLFVGRASATSKIRSGQCVGISGVFRCPQNCGQQAQVIDLIGLHKLNDPDQVGAVGRFCNTAPSEDHSREDLDKDDRSDWY